MKGKNMDSVLYTLSEHIHGQNYVIASYYIKLPKEVDVIKKHRHWQSGRRLEPGFRFRGSRRDPGKIYGKVVNIFDIPALDLVTQIEEDERSISSRLHIRR